MINHDTQLCMSLADHPDNSGTRFHNYLHEKLGLNFIYRTFTTRNIKAAVKGVRALRIHGCAVSMPLKESYIPFLDAIGPSAGVTDPVNTIVNDNGTLTGFNTDYITVKSLTTSYQLDNHARVMIRGSGGVGRAVIAAFRDTGFRDVVVATRNRESGPTLAKQYGFQWQPQPGGITCDVLVDITPIGMAGGEENDELVYSEAMITAASVVLDIIALPSETPVIKLAQQLDKKTIDDAEVIALQAVEQFTMYTGIRLDDELITKAAGSARTG